MPDLEVNPLLSTHKTSDSGFQVSLHPLVLLTISDYITRHTLRRQEGPIVGALLGQQNGRDVTLEHAFECRITNDQGGEVVLHQSWFEERLQQFKDVHKSPVLDLVGWFTVTPVSGPQPHHLPIHRQILEYNESAVLLAFHPSIVVADSATGGELPLTIYESADEGNSATQAGNADKAMQIDDGEVRQQLKFRELPYSVETGEAEMISVDFVARGGGNATAVDDTVKKASKGHGADSPDSKISLGKGKAKVEAPVAQTDGNDDVALLSPEDEELVASLTAKANAIKMLHSRIQLLRTYLSNLPPSYLTTTTPPTPSSEPPSETQTEINHPMLRSIQALVNRLPLLIPANRSAFEQEMLSEKNDVSLVALVGTLSKNLKDVREMGRKFGIVDSARQSANRKGPASGGGGGGTINDDFYASMGSNGNPYASPLADFGGRSKYSTLDG
ncbi:MAG: hypothetical protein M1827_006652 [Pycnora praestabilis]|nr:MAG: hypothetical protein M1827_006652 [Pycnora praestabilis]